MKLFVVKGSNNNMKQPGERERRLLARLVAALAEYFGRSASAADRAMATRLLTNRGAPLASFKAQDFAARVDLDCLIA
jgi:hypothetical protein